MLAPFFWMQPSMWLGLLLKGHTAELILVDCPSPFLQSCFPAGSQLVLLLWILCLWNSWGFFSQFLQPVEIPSKGTPALQCADQSFQPGVIHKLAEGTFHLADSQAAKCSTDIKQHHPDISSWWMPLMLTKSCSLHYKTLIFQPLHTTSFPQNVLCSSPTQSISLHLGSQDAMEDHTENLAKVKGDSICCFPFIWDN